MNTRIWLSLAHMGGREQEFIQEAFDTNWVVPLGPNVDAFEKALADYLSGPSGGCRERNTVIPDGVPGEVCGGMSGGIAGGNAGAAPEVRLHGERSDKAPVPTDSGQSFQGVGDDVCGRHVVALSAGTAALHLGLILLGVKSGDEVICQSFTFSASANPITYQGATPVFVDSEPYTWNMDPVLLEEAIKDRLRKTGKLPKAILPVHLYGMPAQMDRICAIVDRYGIPVLEDAAEALGSELHGRKCGTFGSLAALSFNGNKMITTSGGGALVCRSEEEASRAKFYATQARDAAPHYQHSRIGYNYRMSNICAGIGRGQMFVLEEHISRRRTNHKLYTELLKEVPGIRVLQNPGEQVKKDSGRSGTLDAVRPGPGADSSVGVPGGVYDSNFWLSCITVDPVLAGCTREDLRLALDADNIESRPLWKPMHLQPVFADAPFYGNGTSERLFDRGLCLPSGPTLTEGDIERVTEVIKRVVRSRK